jgi:hypothetical protein
MIQEMCSSCLSALQNQWRDMVVAFKRLANSLPEGDARIALTGNPDLNTFGNPGGLEWRARNEVDSLDGVIRTLPQMSLNDLLANLPNYLRASYATYNAIRNGPLNPPPNAPAARPFEAADMFGDPGRTAEEQACRDLLDALQQFLVNNLREFEELGTRSGDSSNLRGIRGSVEDIASYPILTSDAGSIAPISAPSAPLGTPPSLQRRVDDALRQVLGRLPRTSDPRSFRAALMQSFTVTEIEGHVEFAWTPRSYAGQTELGGGVTGAQASLYARAKVAADNALPLLDGLYPLLPEYDPQLVDAARSIVRTQFGEIVGELGVEGGPRVIRVDILFDSLISQPINEGGSIYAGGYLGYLRGVMGLTPDQVNTLEEETNVTNFIVIRDYIQSLQTSWQEFRNQWLGKDLGTRLVLLSRALSVTAEAVQEVWAAMDSVFVGSAERQVARFRDLNGNELLVDELLTWVVTFASEEAPDLVHEGGRRGIAAIIPTAIQLEALVSQFLQATDYDPLLPVGLRHPRVKNPLRELRTYLQKVRQLAEDVQRPIAQYPA